MDSFTDADALIEDDDEAEQNLVIQATNVISFQLLREVSGESDLSKAISVNLHGKQLCQIQALESCPNLRMLDLSFNRIRKIDGLSTLTKLKELKLYDNLIPVIENCAQLTALHTLDISSNRLASLEGIACLRGLKVLRCAYNGLSSLEGLGRATQLESLDAAFNKVCELGSSLSSCVALRELVLDGNGLSSLRGLQRCDKLEELRVADNALSSLQGLRAAAGSLDTLDCTRNQLSSLEGLAEGCLRLHELYAAENRLSSLEGLALKAPALETLDVSGNPLHAATPAAPPGVAGSRRSSTNGVTPSSPPSPSPSLTPQPSADLAPSKRLQHGHKPGRSAAAARPSPMPLPPAASAPAAKAGKRPASTAGSASRVAGNTAASVSLSAGRASAGEAGGATPGPSASEAAGAEGLAPSLAALIVQLQLLPDLTSVRLEGCAGLPQPGVYQPLLLQAVSSLEAVDDVERPPAPPPVPAAAEAVEARGKGTAGQGGERGPEEAGKLEQADVWVNAGDDQGPDLEQIDNCPTAFIPTIQEIEAFKQRMGINSHLPVMGRPASAKTGSAAADRGSAGPPGAAAGGPRPSSSSGSRPGSALLTRPGSAMSRAGAGNRAGAGGVRDALMHQRPASARMGGGARLMDPEQYSNAVAAFNNTMLQYSSQLRQVLGAMKEGLKLDISDAAQQVKTAEGAATRQLPSLPVVPDMPPDMARRLLPAAAPHGAIAAQSLRNQQQQQQGQQVAQEQGLLGNGLGPQAGAGAGAGVGAGGVKASASCARPPQPWEEEDPQIAAALALCSRVFPCSPTQPLPSTLGATPLSAPAAGPGSSQGSAAPSLGKPSAVSLTAVPRVPSASTPAAPHGSDPFVLDDREELIEGQDAAACDDGGEEGGRWVGCGDEVSGSPPCARPASATVEGDVTDQQQRLVLQSGPEAELEATQRCSPDAIRGPALRAGLAGAPPPPTHTPALLVAQAPPHLQTLSKPGGGLLLQHTAMAAPNVSTAGQQLSGLPGVGQGHQLRPRLPGQSLAANLVKPRAGQGTPLPAEPPPSFRSTSSTTTTTTTWAKPGGRQGEGAMGSRSRPGSPLLAVTRARPVSVQSTGAEEKGRAAEGSTGTGTSGKTGAVGSGKAPGAGRAVIAARNAVHGALPSHTSAPPVLPRPGLKARLGPQ